MFDSDHNTEIRDTIQHISERQFENCEVTENIAHTPKPDHSLQNLRKQLLLAQVHHTICCHR